MQLCCNIIPARCFSEHNILEKLDICMNLYLVHTSMFGLTINKLKYFYKFSMFFFYYNINSLIIGYSIVSFQSEILFCIVFI